MAAPPNAPIGTAALSVGDMEAPAAAGLTDESNREIKSCAKEDSSNATLNHHPDQYPAQCLNRKVGESYCTIFINSSRETSFAVSSVDGCWGGGSSAFSISTSSSCEEAAICAWSLSSVTFAKVGPYSVVIRARTWASVNLVTHNQPRDGGEKRWGERGTSTVQPRLPRLRERDGERETGERMSCHSILSQRRRTRVL